MVSDYCKWHILAYLHLGKLFSYILTYLLGVSRHNYTYKEMDKLQPKSRLFYIVNGNKDDCYHLGITLYDTTQLPENRFGDKPFTILVASENQHAVTLFLSKVQLSALFQRAFHCNVWLLDTDIFFTVKCSRSFFSTYSTTIVAIIERLHAGFWHLWSGTPPFCWMLRHAGISHQNWARPTEFSSCCTDRLELSSGTPVLDTD